MVLKVNSVEITEKYPLSRILQVTYLLTSKLMRLACLSDGAADAEDEGVCSDAGALDEQSITCRRHGHAINTW